MDFINRTKSWRAVAALPNFLETVPTTQDSVVLAIHRGLSAAEHLRISGAATALIRWSRLIHTHALPSIPRRLIEQLLSMIETRQEEGLHLLAAIALIKDGTLTGEDMTRLTRTLSDLREDTKYSSVLLDSRRAVSISLVRQQCVRLAQLLKQKISDDGTLDRWLEEGHSDPLPEVRAGYTWPGISISPYLRAGTLKRTISPPSTSHPWYPETHHEHGKKGDGKSLPEPRVCPGKRHYPVGTCRR
jgi:hypothetical protein